MIHNNLLRQSRSLLFCICLLAASAVMARGVAAGPRPAILNAESTGAAEVENLVAPRQEPGGPNRVIAEAKLPDGRSITRATSADPSEPVRVLVQLPGQPVAPFAVERFNRLQGLTTGESQAIKEHSQLLEAERAAFIHAARSSGVRFEVLGEHAILLSAVALSVQRDDIPLLRALPDVRAVEEDRRLEIMVDQSVPLIRADDVWEMEDLAGQKVTGRGVRIAIIDSGIDYEHPDLGGCFGPGCRVRTGYDFVNNDGDPMDDNGHGTHVAGIAAANGSIKGVAPDATLLAYKACDAYGSCWSTHVIAALEAAVNPDGNPATADAAHVANLSLGSAYGSPNDMMSQAVDSAVAAGLVVAVSAGNDYSHHTIGSPGGARQAITVAASDRDDHITDFSSRGPIMGHYDILKPDVAAPGANILSTASSEGYLSDSSGYIRLDGTSMAAPHVAGAAALLRQLHPDWPPAAVKSALMGNTVNLNETLFAQGTGRINVFAAAQEMLVTTPSAGLGLPLMDGATQASLTLANRSAASLQVSLEVEAARFMDGALRPLEPAQPVDHASLSMTSLSIPAGATRALSLDLDIPDNLADGYYAGVVRASWSGGATELPFMYAALSKLTVHIVDETGHEMTDYSFDLFVAVTRYAPNFDFGYVNWGPGISAVPPFTFYGPPGQYVTQAIDRYFAWNDCTAEPPEPLWLTPYYLLGTTSATLSQPGSITLDLRDADRTAIVAEPTPTTPISISTLTFAYEMGDRSVGLNTLRLGGPCPTSHLEQLLTRNDLLLAQPVNGPGNVRLRAEAYGFSPAWRDMLIRNPAEWHECLAPCPPAQEASNGITLADKADRRYVREWIIPGDSPTPNLLVLADDASTHVNFKFDLPGTIRNPNLSNGNNNAVGTRAAEVFPHGYYSTTGKTIGLRQDFYAHGRAFIFGASEHLDKSPVFYREFYERDLSAARPVEYFPPNLLEVPYEALSPLPPSSSAATFGGGPFYPALTFDNRADSIRIAYPVLGASGGNGVVTLDNLDAQLVMHLYYNGQDVGSESLAMGSWYLPALVRHIAVDPGDDWQVVIEAHNNQIVGHDMTIDARFALPADDMNPPQILDLMMPQRFVKGIALPVALRVADPESGIANVGAELSRNGGNSWVSLPLSADGDTWSGSIVPNNETEIAVRFVVEDEAGNELRFEELGASVRETPVELTIALSTELLPYGNTPVTLGITGSLLLANQASLSEQGLVAIEVYLNNEPVGYIHERARQVDGTIQPGEIDFDWTFVPTDFVAAPGDYPLTFVFDLGTYRRAEKMIMLHFREAPQAANDSYFTRVGTALAIAEPGVLVNDYLPAGYQNTAQLFETPQHGELTLDASGAFHYVPDPGYVGNDSFRYRVLSEIPSAPAMVTITVGEYRLALPYIVR